MEHLKTLLIANRGEIATRIIRTAKAEGIRTIAIYTHADAASTHVVDADESVLLSGGDAKGYLDGDEIVKIAKERKANAIIPGYGFLSENSDFARSVAAAGMVFVGPSPDAIESFGLKHKARELAVKAGVPIVPGTDGLVQDEDEAVRESERLGFPVMLKATAGGGGMGLSTCKDVKEVKEAFAMVKSRGENLFKNAGVFIERYYPDSHHIEVQVFGNGLGDAIHFGERECSIQRRHQKVIEECPSPFVERHGAEMRAKLGNAAVSLTKLIKYGSAGTIEYLVDDKTGDFFFLEMNTRLQVEHGITELCYDVDLVQLMLKQADAELAGQGGIDAETLEKVQPTGPKGAAIECRVYAENPARDYAPSPGTLQMVQWRDLKGSRVDTWVHTGTIVSSHYDPLLAKLMYHSSSRERTIKSMHQMLVESRICGPPTNIDFLATILDDPQFVSGVTMTKFLTTFKYAPAAIDVIAGGAYTQVQDYPGRPTMGRGFPHAGPMDPLAFQIGNLLVGNRSGEAGLEITLNGPDLIFLGKAVVAVCGAPMECTLDGKRIDMWTRTPINAGQRLKIGKTTAGGCRSYLSIYGGFPTVAEWFGSKATSPGVAVGGYQGRQLSAGDLLGTAKEVPEYLSKPLQLPEKLIPKYTKHWDILAMVGPYDDGYLLPEDLEMIYSTTWQISHNAARGGVRLIGPKPKWARKDGGEGGAHPSNVVEYGYPVGTLNWTGDDPCIFPVDCPDFGGFVSTTTIIKADYWRLGQMKAGDTMRYRKVSLEDALAMRKLVDGFVESIGDACIGKGNFDNIMPLDYTMLPASTMSDRHGKATLHQIKAQGNRPLTIYRQGADDYLLVEYGEGNFDINHRCRVTALTKALRESTGPISFSSGLVNTVGCCTSLLIYYDGTRIPQNELLSYLIDLESQLGDLSKAKVPSRIFKLPITFESKRQTAAIQRYIETQRPYASYLPDNMEFVAKNNGIERKDLERILTNSKLMAISVGFFAALPLCLPVDPRERLNCPKMNPSRVFTPAGQVSWGGSCMALYNVESPGGYQLTGLTIPGIDYLGSKAGYSVKRPWLFEDFDQLMFYEVSEEEYEARTVSYSLTKLSILLSHLPIFRSRSKANTWFQRQLAVFESGRYIYEIEECTFDMAEHNALLDATRDEVKAMKARQAKAQAQMDKLEAELMAKWMEEKAAGKIPMDKVEALLNDPDITKIEAPLNANVWKVTANEGDAVDENTVVAILEAMKLEIAVRGEGESAKGKIERLLVRPGDVVKAGDPLVLVRKG